MSGTESVWIQLLKNAQAGDQDSLTTLIQKLQPGLTSLLRSWCLTVSAEDQALVLKQTIAVFTQKINQIRTSPQGFAIQLLFDSLLNFLLSGAKSGHKIALNELIRLMYVRLVSDPQFSKQGWGSVIDDDLLQDASIVFLKKMDEELNDNPYLYWKQIIRYKINDRINARKREQERVDYTANISSKSPADTADEAPFDVQQDEDFVARIADRDLLQKILEVITDLSEFCQTFFTALYKYQDEKLWRIQAKLGFKMTESALNTRIHRCRHGLKRLLKERDLI